ncbi:MAG: TetR/AcrR family transcriptional regulator [Gammaproteobacteria bacterium]|jgi:AcrR family transcriptional regulator
MSSAPEHASSDLVREAILDAAQTRLLRFGYHKTTMSEIADDTGMSAANLYRYFKNKQDIVAECTARCVDERLGRLRALVRDESLDACNKLRHYALELVDDSHELTEADSMMGELVDAVTRDRPDLLHSKFAVHYELIAEILESGNHTGEFSVADVRSTAQHIFAAFTIFDVPLFVGLYDRREFEERAIGVVDLLINGIAGPDALKPRN